MVQKVIVYLSGILLIGCVSTKMNVYKDPDFSGISYRSVIVSSDLQGLGPRGHMESHICRELSEFDVQCQRAMDVSPPTKRFPDEQQRKRIAESGAEALILIELKDSSSEQYDYE